MVNYLAVLVSAVVSFFIGFIWYGPLFGKIWVKLMGFSDKQIKEQKDKGMASKMIVAFSVQVIMAYVVSRFVIPGDILGGAVTAAWLWLGLVATIMIGKVLWEGKPLKLYLLDVSHFFVVLLVMGVILGYWI